MANPITQYHREQRKKEVKKNKTQRIKARDERVAETQTVASVKAAIAVLEKKKKLKEGHLDNSECRTLERLQKELKIVTEKQEQDRQKAAATRLDGSAKRISQAEALQKREEELYGHIDPTLSVYYHPSLNPYGAPPPGKPRMWISRMGGTTMDPSLAGMPGETVSQTIPPPIPPPPLQSPQPIFRLGPPESTQNHEGLNAKQSKKNSAVEDNKKVGKSSHLDAEATSDIGVLPPQPAKNLDIPPPLPKPSEAVQRGKKSRTLKMDIWASNDEMQYYQYDQDIPDSSNTTSQTPLKSQWKLKKPVKKDFDISDPCCPAGEQYGEYRGDIPSADVKQVIKKKKKNKEILVDLWYYKDNHNGNIQGPYTSAQMLQWVSAGFFPPTTPIRNGEDGSFISLDKVDLNAPLVQNGAIEEDLKEFEAQMSLGEDGIAARIAALKAGTESSTSNAEDEKANNCESSAQIEGDDERIQNSNGVPDDEELLSKVDVVAEVYNKVGPEFANEVDQLDYDSVYPTAAAETADHGLDTYPGTTAYPMPEAGAPYPTDLAYPEPDDDHDDAEYPTDLSYPTDLAYPTVDENDHTPYGQMEDGESIPAYYSVNAADFEDSGRSNSSKHDAECKRKKKKFTGDRNLIGFVPANVQVKRQLPTSDGPPKKKSNTTGTLKNTSNVDHSRKLEQFISELEEL